MSSISGLGGLDYSSTYGTDINQISNHTSANALQSTLKDSNLKNTSITPMQATISKI